MRGKHLKKPQLNKGSRLKVPDAQVQALDLDYPVFCFKHLHSNYCLDQCDKDEKSALIDKLATFSKMTWLQIQMADKHGLGSEKIPRRAIKPSIPQAITEDIQDFLALRFQGMKPFVGYRNHFIFHVVYVDRDFTVYDH